MASVTCNNSGEAQLRVPDSSEMLTISSVSINDNNTPKTNDPGISKIENNNTSKTNNNVPKTDNNTYMTANPTYKWGVRFLIAEQWLFEPTALVLCTRLTFIPKLDVNKLLESLSEESDSDIKRF
ncbi:744_t:CDS:2 [Acaulospora colombiana]|uniref:744_t:CDS:1 n=1 Tax=Acaulospora colombiana TaxID=27376 RepID=A0ACA9KB82_9GLOM|nr:744_t:CDS:2 [Acaulospora colombiana]